MHNNDEQITTHGGHQMSRKELRLLMRVAATIVFLLGAIMLYSFWLVRAETPDGRCEKAFPDAMVADAQITTNGSWLICRVIEADLSERLTWVTRNGPVEEIGDGPLNR